MKIMNKKRFFATEPMLRIFLAALLFGSTPSTAETP
jgi:hypothetical protein